MLYKNEIIFLNQNHIRSADSYSDYQINLRNWTIPFGRKFRAIRIWFMMKWFGKEGMIASSKQHLGEHLFHYFAKFIKFTSVKISARLLHFSIGKTI